MRHYFVDEAGDAALFNRRKQIVVGKEGCSRFFLLGCLEVKDPGGLASDLDALRAELLSDPFLRGIPSMQPERGRTTSFFHAKDDPVEVRYRVFKLLAGHDLRFHAVVRTKASLVESVRLRNEQNPDYRYNENEVYDGLVARLFKDRLHKAEAHCVTFARRGISERTAALRNALDEAKRRFHEQWGILHRGPVDVVSTFPRHSAGLQATDYMLWALQRFYERREERYIQAVWPQVGLVIDLDDRRRYPYGEYYTRTRKIGPDAIGDRTPGA